MPILSSSRIRWLRSALHANGPLALILLAHLPIVLVHFRNLWQNGLHGHFPFVLAAAAGLIWNRWSTTRVAGRCQSSGCALFLACGLVLLFFATRLDSPWLGYVAALVSLGAILLRVCSAPIDKWGPAWLLLWLLLPLPMGLDRQLSLELQSYSSRSASLLLDFFRVNHLRAGNVIEIPGMKFSVEEACSGIQSLFVLGAAAAVLAVVFERRGLHAIGLIASAAGWAGAANMSRVAGVVIAAAQFGFDLASGWRHELFGFALFVTALGLILSTDRVLWLLLGPASNSSDLSEFDSFFEEQGERSEAAVDSAPVRRVAIELGAIPPDHLLVVRHLGVLQSWTVAGMFAALGVLQCVPRSTITLRPVPAPSICLENLSAATLPDELAGWRRRSYQTERRGTGNSAGISSAIWRYERAGCVAVVSLDFPFSSWHTLTQCYSGRGGRVLDWHLEPLAKESVVEPASQPLIGEMAVASLKLENGRPATLLFSEWNAAGVLLPPPVTEGPSLPRLLADLQHRWARSDWQENADQCIYQLQVLIPNHRWPSATGDETALRRLFAESLRMLRKKTTKAPGGAS